MNLRLHKMSQDIMGTGHIIVRMNATFVKEQKKNRLKIHMLLGGQSRLSRLKKKIIYTCWDISRGNFVWSGPESIGQNAMYDCFIVNDVRFSQENNQ